MINFDVYPPELHVKTRQLINEADANGSPIGKTKLTAYGHALGISILTRTANGPANRQEVAEQIFEQAKQAAPHTPDLIGYGMEEVMQGVRLELTTRVESIAA